MDRFEFEALDIFPLTIDMVVHVDAVCRGLPSARKPMGEQLKRTSNAVVTHLAEGAGESRGEDQVRYYRLARRAATDVAAQLAVAHELGAVSRRDASKGRSLLLRVVAILGQMLVRAEVARGAR